MTPTCTVLWTVWTPGNDLYFQGEMERDTWSAAKNGQNWKRMETLVWLQRRKLKIAGGMALHTRGEKQIATYDWSLEERRCRGCGGGQDFPGSVHEPMQVAWCTRMNLKTSVIFSPHVHAGRWRTVTTTTSTTERKHTVGSVSSDHQSAPPLNTSLAVPHHPYASIIPWSLSNQDKEHHTSWPCGHHSCWHNLTHFGEGSLRGVRLT